MSLSKIDEDILFSVAEGGKSFYDFTRKESISSNTVVLSSLGRLQNLGPRGFIYQGPLEARGKKPYLLTEDGFDYVIRDIKRISVFDNFVKNNKHYFPLVLNYWDELLRYGLQEWVKFVLENIMKHIDSIISYELITGIRSMYSHNEFITDLYIEIYGPFLILQGISELRSHIPKDDINKFLEDKNDIKQHISQRIKEHKKVLLNKLTIIEEYEQENPY